MDKKSIFPVLSMALPFVYLLLLFCNFSGLSVFLFRIIIFLLAFGFIPGVVCGIIGIVIYSKMVKKKEKVNAVYLIFSIIGIILNVVWFYVFVFIILYAWSNA